MDLDAAEDAVNLPSIALIVMGVLNLLIWGAFAVLALPAIVLGGFSTLFGAFGSLLNIVGAMDSGGVPQIAIAVAGIVSTALAPVMTIVNGAWNLVVAVASIGVILAGAQLRNLQGPGLQKLAVVVLIGGPLGSLGILVLGTLIAMLPGLVQAVVTLDPMGIVFALFSGCCGLNFVGGAFSLVTNGAMLVANGGVATFTLATLANEDVAAALAAEE